jgi:hypothetical protein
MRLIFTRLHYTETVTLLFYYALSGQAEMVSLPAITRLSGCSESLARRVLADVQFTLDQRPGVRRRRPAPSGLARPTRGQRAVCWLVCQLVERLLAGDELRTVDVARLGGMRAAGAWRLLDRMSAVLPLTTEPDDPPCWQQTKAVWFMIKPLRAAARAAGETRRDA